MKNISKIKTPKVLTPDEDQQVRALMQNMRTNMPKKQQWKRQAIGFNHHNADGFSHKSMGTKFRRYGK